jgi:quercetin dioxygenase-like cupin family protein
VNKSFAIQRRAEASLLDDYGCQFWRILPWGSSGASENGMGLGIVPPGGRTEVHSHEEVEHFLVVSGKCEAHVGDERIVLQEGDVIKVQSGSSHYFENISPGTSLELLCLWTRGEFGGSV